jgi:hypothetical protein
MTKRSALTAGELLMLKSLGNGEMDISMLHEHLAEYVKAELADGALAVLLETEPCPDDPTTNQTKHSKIEVIAAAAAVLAYCVADMVREDESAACLIFNQCAMFAHSWMHEHFAVAAEDAGNAPPEPTVDGPGTMQ